MIQAVCWPPCFSSSFESTKAEDARGERINARLTEVLTLLEPIGASRRKDGGGGADIGPMATYGVPQISLDVEGRRIDLEVPDDELARRTPNAATLAGFANPRRGWERLYVDHVRQADTGADLDFLIGASGSVVTRESH